LEHSSRGSLGKEDKKNYPPEGRKRSWKYEKLDLSKSLLGGECVVFRKKKGGKERCRKTTLIEQKKEHGKEG